MALCSKIKIAILNIAVAVMSFVAAAQPPPQMGLPADAPRIPQTKLIGLVNIEGLRGAMLEFNFSSFITNAAPTITHEFISVGKKSEIYFGREGTFQFEIASVDFTNATVTLIINGVRTTCRFSAASDTATNLPSATFRWHELGYEIALDFYSGQTKRALLIYPLAKTIRPLEVIASPHNQDELAEVLETALKNQGLAFLPDGEKFIQVVPKMFERRGIVKPDSLPTKGNPLASSGPVFMQDVPLDIVAQSYAQWAGLKLAPIGAMPAVTITLKLDARSLTAADILHAFDVLLDWHRIKMVKVDDDTLQAVLIDPRDQY